jgi:CheY-like chemotaxis protein
MKTDYNVLRAKDGVEAVDVCKKSTVDLILMDCRMPNMDGLEATEIIHGFLPELPIIMQSAYAFEDDKQKAAEAGCCDFLTKPITRQALMDMLNKYLC